MGITRRRLNLRVSNQFADHRQPFADEQSAGCECVTEIVNAYVTQPRGFPDATPRIILPPQKSRNNESSCLIWSPDRRRGTAIPRAAPYLDRR
jgi:hypothetical protein